VNLPVCTFSNAQSLPAVALDMKGGVYICWDDLRSGTNKDVYAAHVLPSGVLDPSWPTGGLLVCDAAAFQSRPKMTSDGAGGVIIAWVDTRSGVSSDIYAHHLLANGTLDPAWPVNGSVVCNAIGAQVLLARVSLVSDRAGGAVVAWRDSRNDTDLYATRILASGQLDPSWPAGGMPVGAGPGTQFNASITADGLGGFFAAWQDTRSGPNANIYGQHLLVNGTIAAGWPTDGSPVCTATGLQQFPTISLDDAGGAFIGWEDLRGTTSDIYVGRVRSDGTADPAWPVDGRAVCSAFGNQTQPQVLGDGHGGAFVAWTDARAGSVPALYAQHLLANGALDPAWPSTDLNFDAVFANDINLVLMSDGAGGALALWDDNRSGVLDVYAHHLLVGGTVDPSWPTNGRGVGTASNSQNADGAGVPDGSGGLVVAWIDSRSFATNGTDIYAQRVQANGQLGGDVLDVPPAGERGLALAPIRPTPSRSGHLGVRYNLPRDGRVSFELIDVSGRRLAARDLGEQQSGPHSFDWDASILPTAGLCFVRLRFGSESLTVRAITLD
jgi:hypothetical protein